ncbi:MAG TPA: hypothetical protein VFZ09_43830 [Archangium sp.]|uniref:hypothetical protein n=1 Tax=Archangium sp. TaxID=1872627 RepID=UPI002E366460|nr:hypothetical protein [Archangium sp.]HEX5753211.1 hypothetical protein [Archangium sp.]
MIRMQSRELPAETLAELADLQQEIDNHPTYLERVRAALELWPSRRRRKVFDRVEKELGDMCPGLKRCMFCEDNGAYQIEHFRPKALYPKLVYAWANYLFACGQCNGPKSDRFAIFSANGKVLELVRTDSDPESEPSVLLDPRRDEPMDYLWLDLRGTFRFKPIHPEGTPEYDRADLTLDWLGLNERDELVEARRNAYDDYLVRFEKYVAKKRANCDAETLKRLRRSIERSTHITVWREMQRQRQTVDELRALFEEAPEALEWP